MNIKTDYKGYCPICSGHEHSFRKVFLYDISSVLREYQLSRLIDPESCTTYCSECFEASGVFKIVVPIMEEGLFFKVLHKAIDRGDRKFELFLLRHTVNDCRICGESLEFNGIDAFEADMVERGATNREVFKYALKSIGGTDKDHNLLRYLCRGCYEVSLLKSVSFDQVPLYMGDIRTDRGRDILRDRFSKDG